MDRKTQPCPLVLRLPKITLPSSTLNPVDNQTSHNLTPPYNQQTTEYHMTKQNQFTKKHFAITWPGSTPYSVLARMPTMHNTDHTQICQKRPVISPPAHTTRAIISTTTQSLDSAQNYGRHVVQQEQLTVDGEFCGGKIFRWLNFHHALFRR